MLKLLDLDVTAGDYLSKLNSSSCSWNQFETICGAVCYSAAIRRWIHCGYNDGHGINNTLVGCGV